MDAVIQRLAVAASCVVFWLLATGRMLSDLELWLLGVLSLFACVEKLCDIMNTISVERDWVCLLLLVLFHAHIYDVTGCRGCYGWSGGFRGYVASCEYLPCRY